tara:strand:- start:40 stop:723 length:684 start_codon:yes stop_codon:yes gene_type:complete
MGPMATLALIGAVLFIGFIFFIVTRLIMFSVVKYYVNQEKSSWVKIADQMHVFHRLLFIIPGLTALALTPIIQDSSIFFAGDLSSTLQIMVSIYFVGVMAAVGSALLDTIQIHFDRSRSRYGYSIKSYIQICKIFLFFISVIIIISIMIGQSALHLLTGLGAMTAIGMLVFRDSILGFVASIQLSAYDIIRVGDWIEMTKYGADGTVIDISLNTMKIQNFDNTIVTA